MFLGLVQGLTEFLPVSSSGHLILFQRVFGIESDMIMFNIMLHIATLLAVLFVFRKRIWQLMKNPFQQTTYVLLLATVITVSFVLAFHDFIESTFTASILPISFMITAIVLFSTTFIPKRVGADGNQPSGRLPSSPTYFSGAMTGLAQGLAVVPGFSRSGFTIATAMATGTRRESAAEFSFLMSIPIIIAALVFEVVSSGGVTMSVNWLQMSLAFVVALVSGIFAIKFMLAIVREVKLYWFSLYLVVLAIITIFIV